MVEDAAMVAVTLVVLVGVSSVIGFAATMLLGLAGMTVFLLVTPRRR